MDWQQKTAEQAYWMVYSHEVEYRLPNHDKKVEQFTRWQGVTGDVYTGQFVIYLEGSDIPHILDQYDTVLVREIEIEPEESEPETVTDEIAKIYVENKKGLYRIKLFQNIITVERQQPHNDNVMFNRKRYQNLYDADLSAWNIDTINRLLKRYERYIIAVERKPE